MSLPRIVPREEWRAAREELLLKEKALTRARDALDAERRRLPMVEVDEEYVFEGGDGKATLLDLFRERHQLIVYHFAFAPEWQTGSRDCSAFLDQVGHLAHLRARGTEFAVVSRAPYTRILPFKARMGWTVPWYSSHGNAFDHDHGAVERPGVSCFLRERERVFLTYSAYGRGLEGLGSTAGLLALTALGAVGDERVRYHDEYEE